MTTTNDPRSDLRAWAAAQLGAAAETRAALLRRLATDAFCPTSAADYAQRVLAEAPIVASADLGRQQALAELEADLRGEVESLTRHLFALPATTRRRRWQELRQRCGPFPALAARVADLERGLDADPAELDGPLATLAEMLCELFALPPTARARRRRALLAQLSGEESMWATTAEDLQARYPRYAALDPPLVTTLAGARTRTARVRAVARARAKAPPAAGGGGFGSRVPILIIVVVVIGLIRACISVVGGPNPPAQPPWHPPAPPPWQGRPIPPAAPNIAPRPVPNPRAD